MNRAGRTNPTTPGTRGPRRGGEKPPERAGLNPDGLDQLDKGLQGAADW